MAIRQTPFLEEIEGTPDPWHCFNCGCGDVSMDEIKAAQPGTNVRILKYRSIYPLKPLYITYDGQGKIDRTSGVNGDYTVCEPCYILQWNDRYPDDTCPVPKD